MPMVDNLTQAVAQNPDKIVCGNVDCEYNKEYICVNNKLLSPYCILYVESDPEVNAKVEEMYDKIILKTHKDPEEDKKQPTLIAMLEELKDIKRSMQNDLRRLDDFIEIVYNRTEEENED